MEQVKQSTRSWSRSGAPRTSTSMSPTGRWRACPSCRAAQDP